jgi:hypothetical protein
MTRTNIGWIILGGCLVAVVVAVFFGQWPMPQQAQAAPPPISLETTQACHGVVEEIVTIQQTVLNERRAGILRGLAPLDAIVAQEFQINTSRCPSDFRMAAMRFIAAEDSARIHAHMDRTGKLGEALTAGVEVFASHGFAIGKAAQSLDAYNQKIADEQKQDLANIQATLLDLAQVAMKYGVK